jgi:hypothetical protein
MKTVRNFRVSQKVRNFLISAFPGDVRVIMCLYVIGVRVTLRLEIYLQSVPPSPSRFKTIIFFQLNTWGHCPYVTSSLTRGFVCRLQLLLVLASAVILRYESRGTHGPILPSQIPDSPNLEGQVPGVYIPQEEGGPVLPPGTGFPFRRLLRLAGLRWRYSNPSPRGLYVIEWCVETVCSTFRPLWRHFYPRLLLRAIRPRMAYWGGT